MNVLVTGGTGVLGREVVNELRAAGHRARVLSRQPGGADDWIQGDLATGAGLDEAVEDMEGVVHAASAARDPRQLRATDEDGTKRLLAAAARAQIKHFVYVSIVGIDGVAYPYYLTKVLAEMAVQDGGVPWSILRATQFHSFVEVVLRRFDRFPRFLAAPRGWQIQPVDVNEVAVRLTEIVTAEPGGMLPDFGGPEVRRLDSLAESWLEARHANKKIVNLPLPFKFARQFAAGELTTPQHRAGRITFEQYLVRQYGRW